MGHRGPLRARAAWLAVVAPVLVTATATGALARSHPRHVRPGCSRACRNLGGLGAGGENKHPRIAVLAKRVHLQGNVAPIPMRCLARKRCRGILLVDAVPPSPTAPVHQLSRVDLDIPARTELVIEVTLSTKGIQYVRAHSPVRAYVTVVYSNPHIPIDTLSVTLLSPRTPAGPAPAATPRSATASDPPASAARGRRHQRPGCGAQCRNLGLPGGSEATRISIPPSTVVVEGNVASIPLRCNAPPCRGTLLLTAGSPTAARAGMEFARADLNVPRGTELVVELTLSARGLAFLRTEQRVRATLSASYPNSCGVSEQVDSFALTLIAGEPESSRDVATTTASPPRRAAEPLRHVRPGCGTECRSFGRPQTHASMRLLAKTVRMHGTVAAIPMRCITRRPCQGVLQLLGVRAARPNDLGELARADLNIPGRTEVIVEVTLSPEGVAYVRTHTPVPASLGAVYEDRCNDFLGHDQAFAVTILA